MTQDICAWEPLYSSLGGNPDLAEIVEMFVQEMPHRIATLLDQLDASNWEELQRTVHRLKGAAGSYGFAPVTPHAAKLENALREDPSLEEIREMVDALVEMCSRLRAGTP